MKANTSELKDIPIDKLDRNPENPRIFFRQQEMEELTESIRLYGIQVPISVYEEAGRFVIIDGERRYRCSKKLNQPSIPAIVQDKPDAYQNLLLMFNIHALREQWDLLTISLKLPRIIELFKKQFGYEPNEKELSERTGLNRSVIRRSRLLMNLPQHHIDHIKTELDKPKSQQRISEDFYIELERALSTVQNRLPKIIPDEKEKERVRNVLVEKYEDQTIKNMTDFRMLAKMARAENVNADTKRAEKEMARVFDRNDYSIASAFDRSVAPAYAKRDIKTSVESLLEELNELERNQIDVKLRDLLEQLKEIIDRLLQLS